MGKEARGWDFWNCFLGGGGGGAGGLKREKVFLIGRRRLCMQEMLLIFTTTLFTHFAAITFEVHYLRQELSICEY